MFNDPLIGRQLANFRVERIIQRGGMAQVYYGMDVKLHRPVAIKVIDTFYRENPVYARRFVEEARTVATWSHENIIRIYYADDQEGIYYFVMEYIDGSDLGSLLAELTRRGDFISHAEVIRIGRGIAAALDYAHERGVIHRDVKPSNVMVAKDGRVVLMDFGLALSLQGGSIGEAFGTPQYIAPEQANRSADAVPQSDIYSLGVIVYELLTGTIPFDDPSAAALVVQHLLHEPPTPSEINPALNSAIDEVLLKALRKKPEERYRNGVAFIDALEKVLLATEKMGAAAALPSLPPPPVGVDLPEPEPPVTDLTIDLTPNPIATPEPETDLSTQEKRFNWLLGSTFGLGLLVILVITWAFWGQFRGEDEGVVTATPSPTIVLTPSPRPTLVSPTSVAGPVISTVMPTATFTASPTLLPSPTPSPSPSTTAIPLPSLTPSRTLPAPLTEGHEIQLFYDETSFYLLNADVASISIRLITFEAMDENTGEPTRYLFSGRLWSDFFDELEEGKCVRIETVEGPTWMRPQECADYNATVTPANETSDLVFWISRSNVSQFRVLWIGQEVGRCQTHLGLCQIFLPE